MHFMKVSIYVVFVSVYSGTLEVDSMHNCHIGGESFPPLSFILIYVGNLPGGGGVLSFSFIRRLGPSIYCSLQKKKKKKKNQEFQAPQKNILDFSNPKKYPHSVH